jgi:hypothetical protein
VIFLPFFLSAASAKTPAFQSYPNTISQAVRSRKH